MQNKTIGIYLPTKNRVELLKKAVDSVLAQTYSNFKLLIVDDGSTDSTPEYLKSITDPRVSFIRNEQSERACNARNRAIKALDTELVTGLDDDDVFLPGRLERLISVYDPRFAFVCSGYFWDYGAHKKSLFSSNKVISISAALDLNQCSNQILVDRNRVLEVGGFDPELPALQDHDLWVRLIAKYGDAYRLGEELYIVNDDQELERISSVRNKLNAIDLFEKKHFSIMSQRNKENFAFYRKKIKGEKVSFLELLSSSQHGLFSLKVRHALAQNLNQIAKYRLDYMHTGSVDQPVVNWFLKVLIPLIATGGPGASRVILLSSCIFFLGASNTASFGSDFFILMLLNTMFSQSYGFFVLKQDYRNSFSAISRQSLTGLLVAIVILCCLFILGIISNLIFLLPLLIILHFYYLFRFKRIAKHGFFILAIAECFISLTCLIAPIVLSQLQIEQPNAPYIVYVAASFLGLLVVLTFNEKQINGSKNNKVPVQKVINIAISTVASVFALFCFPYTAKLILEPEVASYVALTISCFSIAMLIPRTQANKSLPRLGLDNLSANILISINKSYSKLIWVSCFVSLLVTACYLNLLTVPWNLAFAIPAAIMALFLCSQSGFIYLTTLSLRGKDAIVARLNLMVLIVTLASLSLLVFNILNINMVGLLLPFICITFIGRNIQAKKMIIDDNNIHTLEE
ncbi:glycosyltransferase [Pseudoalteromonas shioyasakiensis]|uniref:glycosyltransferase n=1 Tax=Pseudoalteromonas shioyasakiensis TaxID=1190813 RepID=UPI002118B0BD|nr:glycosyltransferase [Pseudoalteromonas shioyasakiensis]MCQ8879472.1 glycosyltransferase [Pseudoalteromonas shioyasakiensis]